MSKRNTSPQALAIAKPLITILKILVVITILLNWLESAGYSITTLLTGLGIGSLAIALAAQKTLENVFGAFTLYVARPIRPGDFCKFGDIIGAVEEIGLRSTRIRKLDRSVVYVPNSVFASSNVENFTEIDRRHYKRELRIQLNTDPNQIRLLLIELRKLLTSHPRVLDIALRVRFEMIERDAYLIVINGYVDTADINDFKAVAEDLNLRTLEILNALHIEIAMPAQRISHAQHPANNTEAIEQAQVDIDALVKEERLPFPDFDEQAIESMNNSLSYPPKGSMTRETAVDVK